MAPRSLEKVAVADPAGDPEGGQLAETVAGDRIGLEAKPFEQPVRPQADGPQSRLGDLGGAERLLGEPPGFIVE
jgi:hypothetical protein